LSKFLILSVQIYNSLNHGKQEAKIYFKLGILCKIEEARAGAVLPDIYVDPQLLELHEQISKEGIYAVIFYDLGVNTNW
jgi:hypothetical protein